MTDERKLLRIEYVRLDQILPWDRNPKGHDLGRFVLVFWQGWITLARVGNFAEFSLLLSMDG